MEVSRRSFLRGALAVSAAAVTGLPVVASAPILYGDGIHDDTKALQALFDGKPVVCENEMIQVARGDMVWLRGGNYRITECLQMGGARPEFSMADVNIDATDNRDDVAIFVEEHPEGLLSGSITRMNLRTKHIPSFEPLSIQVG